MAFIETGAIQCGYCTPAMILAAKALLDRTLEPDRSAKCARRWRACCAAVPGYVKPVEAVLRAAARMRGEDVPPIDGEQGIPAPPDYLLPAERGEDAAA